MLNNLKRLLSLGILSLGLLTPLVSYSINLDVNSNGGLEVGNPETDNYWFSIGGKLAFDGTIFAGNAQSKGEEFRSGFNLSSMDIYVGGGVGENLSYTLSIEMDGKRKFNVGDAFVTYAGLGENFTISAGQVLTAYSQEGTKSGKWQEFMYRSMPVLAFGPYVHGLGVSANKWGNCYSFNVSATTPKKATGEETKRSDKWSTSARVTLNLVRNDSRIFQVGASGHYENVKQIEFKVLPEAKARNTKEVLNTGFIEGAKNLNTWDLELAYQQGPFLAEFEYQKETIKRHKNITDKSKSLEFHGYHAKVAYVLTGEARKYNPKNGTFNQVIPQSDKGAYEVAARYTYITLNDKDVRGGSAHNAALALNYYINNNVKICGNYIRSHQKAPFETKTRRLNIFAARLQAVF